MSAGFMKSEFNTLQKLFSYVDCEALGIRFDVVKIFAAVNTSEFFQSLLEFSHSQTRLSGEVNTQKPEKPVRRERVGQN